jgi:hypothetical protein
MTKNVKCLITGGCSFSQPNNTDVTWVHHLQDYIQPDKVVHTGIGAAGNGMISRRVISAVTEQLKTYKPDEILVGIMWSEFKRRDYYSIADLETYNLAPRRYYWYSNPTAGYVPEEYYWYIINPHWSDPLTTRFKQNFYNYEDSLINCFEHILRVQWFLQANNIPYFMTEFDYSAFDEFPFARNWKNNSEINFLYNQIDKSQWLPIENCYQWCREKSGKEFARPPDPHPSTAQHKEFANRVIVPYLLEKRMLYDIIV